MPDKTVPDQRPQTAPDAPRETAPRKRALPEGYMRMDLHCHSEASHDCITPLESFPTRCAERGIRVQAITDHNEIWGAQRLKKFVQEEGHDLSVIVGEEVSTLEGEIVGLYLTDCIPAGLSPEETVAEIKRQGGLVLLPHGFDPLKRHRLSEVARERLADSIDIIEVFNARVSNRKWNVAASLWAARRGLAESGGSDAHTYRDIGSAWVELPQRPVTTPAELLEALREGRVDGDWLHPALAFSYKMWNNFRQKVRRKG